MKNTYIQNSKISNALLIYLIHTLVYENMIKTISSHLKSWLPMGKSLIDECFSISFTSTKTENIKPFYSKLTWQKICLEDL